MAKRPYETALAMLKANITVTPAEINNEVGDGLATRHVWQLRKLGYDISVEKDGRIITEYTYNGVGTAQDYEDKMAARAQKEIDKNMKLVEREVTKEAKRKAREEAKAAKELEKAEKAKARALVKAEKEAEKAAKAKARAEAKAAKEAEEVEVDEVEVDEEVDSATTGEYAIDESFDEYDQPLEKLVA